MTFPVIITATTRNGQFVTAFTFTCTTCGTSEAGFPSINAAEAAAQASPCQIEVAA